MPVYLEYCLTQRYLEILKRIYEENYTVMAMRIERILKNGKSTQILQDMMVRLTEEPMMNRLWFKSRRKDSGSVHKRSGRSGASPKDSRTRRKG